VTAAPPAPAPAATATQVDPNRALPIFFEAWSAFLEEPAQQALGQVATYIKANPRIPVLVVGYADPRGSAEANMILSRLRARVVADALIANGVPAARLRIIYRGATPGFESLESRRVEVRVDRGQR
jgi:outer membrane protein OmpA-like peptidoglycan-associated protein